MRYEDDEPCDHDDYDVDIVEGRARCDRCGESWYCSDEEVLRQIDAMAAYSEYEERENRRQWWRDIWYSILHPLRSIHWEMQKRGWFRAVTDDDIPF